MLVTAAYAAGAEHATENSFPPFDSSTFSSQILWLAITFGLFYLFMSRVVLPRIGSILETRRDRIAQDLNEANRLKLESDQAFAAYEQELAEARSNAHEIAQTARDAIAVDTTSAIVEQLIGGTVTKARVTAAVKAAAEGRE